MNEYLIEYLDDNGYVNTKKVLGQTEDQVYEQFYKDYSSGYSVISIKPYLNTLT